MFVYENNCYASDYFAYVDITIGLQTLLIKHGILQTIKMLFELYF